MTQDKQKVRDFLNHAYYGEELYLANQERLGYKARS